MDYSKEHYIQGLEKVYQNIMNNDGRDCPSYQICSKSCLWQNSRKLLPPTGAWIGDNYGENRILFLGINTNQGSPDSKSFWAPDKWFSSDHENIGRATNRIMGKIKGNNINHKKSMHCFAFTNVIKCSVSNKSGAPTDTMSIRCPFVEQYLFQELEILSPKVIFAFGGFPFDVVQNMNFETVESISDNFKDWLFKYSIDKDEVFVCRLYNPGQGYRTPRAAFKKIRENRDIKNWEKFILKDTIANGNIADDLLNKYDEASGIDKANPLYDEIFNTLWNQISKQLQLI